MDGERGGAQTGKGFFIQYEYSCCKTITDSYIFLGWSCVLQMFPLVKLMMQKARELSPSSPEDTLSQMQLTWETQSALESSKYSPVKSPMDVLVPCFEGLTAESLTEMHDEGYLMPKCRWMAAFGCTFGELEDKLAQVETRLTRKKPQVRCCQKIHNIIPC